MTELVTAAQMRGLEQDAISSGAVTGLALMTAAGAGAVDAILDRWPDLRAAQAPRAVVLCGPGNNGGDGYVMARALQGRGWTVQVWALAPPSERCPDARAAAKAWGGTPDDWPSLRDGPAPALVIDALFGTGLKRPVPPEVATIFRDLHEVWGPVGANWIPRRVAVDLPSGLCSDTGRVLAPQADPRDSPVPEGPGDIGWAFVADLTVTFQCPKLGHYLGAGPSLCGAVDTRPLPALPLCDSAWGQGLSHPDHVRLVAPVQCNCDVPAAHYFDRLNKTGAHKYDHGHALVLSGGAGRTGAARLAARGALRVGAGLVTLGVPGSAQFEVASQVTALMLRRVDDGDTLRAVLDDARLNALCLGPGLGLNANKADLIAVALHSRRPVVLDADALTLLGRDTSLFAALHGTCVLTPHGGEFARMFPDLAARLNARGPAFSKADATRAAAARAGCVVLFKGADTVIAAPDGRAGLHAAAYDRAAPWLATAGSGDVLAGFLTGLIARGVDAFDAAEAAAWLHTECARTVGPGLIAEDLPEALPAVFRAIGF